MKTPPIFIVLIFSALLTYSQKKVPAFGAIDIEDLRMKSFDKDPDAEALKLLDLCEVTFPAGRNVFKMSVHRRVRIKILTDKGIDHADVKLPFYSYNNFERITDLSASTYNLAPDGSMVTVKLGKDAIYTQKAEKRWSTITFTMPEVKVGSIIEYSYNEVQESFSRIPNWAFQDDIPTRYSSYTASIPSFFKFVNQTFAYQQVKKTKTERFDRINTPDGLIQFTAVDATYTMENVPALRSEPFMSSFKDYQQRIEFQLSQIDFGGQVTDFRNTWEKLTKELLEDEDFGIQLRKNIPRTKDLDDQLRNVTDAYSRMVIIHNYVKANMSWNGQENIYTSDGVKNAWDKKSGSNGEINLILLNLLRDAGVTAYPLLVSTREHGATNPIYPLLTQFNNVMAYVAVGDNFYVLDGSDKYNPSRVIPEDVINTEGYLLEKDGNRWISLINNKLKWKNAIVINADIDDQGIMKGEVRVNNYDYSRNPRIKKFKEQKNNFNDYFTKDYTSIKVESVEVSNLDIDSLPFEQKVQFSSKLNSSGDYRYFNLNLFTGLEKNPFLADKRQTDVDFGYNQSYAIYGSITIPEGYKVEELPANISMIMPDTSITFRRFLQMDDNILGFRILIDFVKSYYPVQAYDDFKEYNKKLYAKLNEQIVLKKK